MNGRNHHVCIEHDNFRHLIVACTTGSRAFKARNPDALSPQWSNLNCGLMGLSAFPKAPAAITCSQNCTGEIL